MVKEFVTFKTPAGFIRITAENGKITGIYAGAKEERGVVSSVLKEAEKQLKEYFEGSRKKFDLPLFYPAVPAFRMKVWKEMAKIPFGKTRTYGELAASGGNAKAARAAGGACHNNPFMIVVPCHRVIGSNGALTGFAGGLDMKKKLLKLEGVL